MKSKKISIKTILIIVLLGIIIALIFINLNNKNSNITKQEEISKEQLGETTSDNAYISMETHLSEVTDATKIDESVAATADNITAGKQAWVNGELVTGSKTENSGMTLPFYFLPYYNGTWLEGGYISVRGTSNPMYLKNINVKGVTNIKAKAYLSHSGSSATVHFCLSESIPTSLAEMQNAALYQNLGYFAYGSYPEYTIAVPNTLDTSKTYYMCFAAVVSGSASVSLFQLYFE